MPYEAWLFLIPIIVTIVGAHFLFKRAKLKENLNHETIEHTQEHANHKTIDQ